VLRCFRLRPTIPVNKGGKLMWTKPRFVEIKMDAEAKAYMDELAKKPS
jgi:hypothetical protein